MVVLGIETSCDETSAAVIAESSIRSNVIWSQLEHAKYGGVVPELASRAHIRFVIPVVDAALTEAGIGLGGIDAIAVTKGPGLVGSLIVGINVAKGIALAVDKPFIGVHHLEGHVFSNLIEQQIETPFLTLLASGGHTALVVVERLGHYRLLGQTLDDAAGEAFDKVAKLLDLLPPGELIMGGRAVAQAALGGDPRAVDFPRPLASTDSLDFSFSGLKTAVLNYVRRLSGPDLSSSVADIAASFQTAVVDVLVDRTERAMSHLKIPQVTLAGGVAANQILRDRMRAVVEDRGGKFYCPSPVLCTDNAAMIAAAGHFHLGQGRRSSLDLDATPRLPLPA